MTSFYTFQEFLNEKRKPKGAPDWHDSDAPDAEGRFRDLGIRDLAAWLIKTRNGDMRKITGSINQQVVFNRKKDPEYAKKMEKVREEVKRQLKKDESLQRGVVKCDNCGWSWRLEEGGEDPFTCHECGKETSGEC